MFIAKFRCGALPVYERKKKQNFIMRKKLVFIIEIRMSKITQCNKLFALRSFFWLSFSASLQASHLWQPITVCEQK
jgi:hypothetical protein